jgi:hypothetical protein
MKWRDRLLIDDIAAVHGIITPYTPMLDEEVPQDVLDEDARREAEHREIELKIPRPEYERSSWDDVRVGDWVYHRPEMGG